MSLSSLPQNPSKNDCSKWFLDDLPNDIKQGRIVYQTRSIKNVKHTLTSFEQFKDNVENRCKPICSMFLSSTTKSVYDDVVLSMIDVVKQFCTQLFISDGHIQTIRELLNQPGEVDTSVFSCDIYNDEHFHGCITINLVSPTYMAIVVEKIGQQYQVSIANQIKLKFPNNRSGKIVMNIQADFDNTAPVCNLPITSQLLKRMNDHINKEGNDLRKKYDIIMKIKDVITNEPHIAEIYQQEQHIIITIVNVITYDCRLLKCELKLPANITQDELIKTLCDHLQEELYMRLPYNTKFGCFLCENFLAKRFCYEELFALTQLSGHMTQSYVDNKCHHVTPVNIISTLIEQTAPIKAPPNPRAVACIHIVMPLVL